MIIAEWLENATSWEQIAESVEIRDVNSDIAKKDRCLARAWVFRWCAAELLNEAIVEMNQRHASQRSVFSRLRTLNPASNNTG